MGGRISAVAYRNIKRNFGSNTSGVDRLTIKDIEKIPETKFVEVVRKKLQWYKPKTVRRVEIPKPNGKLRPLGIPAIWDRIVQQCILQILEPICEAKFSDRSNGFRPNRSAEHAIAQAYALMQKSNLHFVVDIDIKGFFDNVNHSKLIKQMWNMGIQDKKLLCVIKEMLKAPIILPNGETIYPRATLINEYNSMIMGMHNYFQIATCVSSDFADMGREVDVVKLSQLKQKALSAKGDYKGFSFIEKKYGKSKQIRFYSGKPLIPVAYVKHKNPMWKKKSVCKYTPEGRREIHKNLGMDTRTMLFLMRTKEVGRSVEYMDNRISLYVAQYGKCAITGKILELHEIHCHHKKPVSQGGNDRYENLTILHKDIHRLLHATKEETIKAYLSQLQLTYKQKAKLNKLRQLANMQAI